MNILLFVTAALLLAGLGAGIWTELLIFLLYGICCALFGMVLRAVFGGRRGLAVLIPVLTIVMLAVCPVFFDVGYLRKLQLLLPPTYYINSAFNPKYLIYLAVYDIVLLMICVVIGFAKSMVRKMGSKGE